MPFTIPQSYVDQFSANIHMLSEQRMSRLVSTVDRLDVTGESFAVERLGGVEINEVTDLGGDTPLNPHPHTRRWGYIKSYDVADRISKVSDIRMLIDPRSSYTIRHAGAMGRGMDDEIIAALGGSAAQGKNAETTVALPSAQKVLTTAGPTTGMNYQKLIEAKKILDQNEVDPMFPRYFVHDANDLAQLMAQEQLTSADYNTVRALVRGEVDTFLGFKFIRIERLPTLSAGVKAGYCYAGPAIRMGVGSSPRSVAAERPDKRHDWQIYTYGSWGAVRVEDALVVEIATAETSAANP
jgi:hypothetical protein